jgi:asparagine synthase (glutamine-hydrolysing)
MREAANRHLPNEWASRPKLGFPVPVSAWLRDEKFYKQVRDLFAQDWTKEFFDQDAILKLIDDNYAGKIDGRRKVWVIYTFLVWYKVFFIDDTIPKFIPDPAKKAMQQEVPVA